jgi:uncharacterized tellurite resistance protein B-like protein
MADWKRLAKRALLADGRIDEKEVQLVREELLADDRIDKSELEFLFELRNGATSTVRAFNQLFFQAVKKHLLEDGSISDAEARWLRKMIFADGTVDADEKKFLQELKNEARQVSGEFQTLYDQCMAS